MTRPLPGQEDGGCRHGAGSRQPCATRGSRVEHIAAFFGGTDCQRSSRSPLCCLPHLLGSPARCSEPSNAGRELQEDRNAAALGEAETAGLRRAGGRALLPPHLGSCQRWPSELRRRRLARRNPPRGRHFQPRQRGKALGYSPAAVLGVLQHGSLPEALACQPQLLFLNLPVPP